MRLPVPTKVRAFGDTESKAVWLCREKLAAVETKLKAAVQDKTNVQMEKAALERELKSLKGQAGRLTKVSNSPSNESPSKRTISRLHADVVDISPCS